MKDVFTTGEAARICKVSQQTIIRWFDAGLLNGFHVPGSRFRRIPRQELLRFMRDNGVPTDSLDIGLRRLLVIDDDVDLSNLITGAFQRDGRFDLRAAHNGFDAGFLVEQYRPEIVVLDVMLPDIGGIDICRRLRQNPAHRETYVVCISGNAEQRMIDDLRIVGANDFVTKPFDVNVLVERVCRHLGMRLNGRQ